MSRLPPPPQARSTPRSDRGATTRGPRAASTATNEHGRLDDRNPPVTPLAFGLLPALHGGVVLFVLGDAACRLRPLTVLGASRSPVRCSGSADRGGRGGGPGLESAVRMRQGPAVGRQHIGGGELAEALYQLGHQPRPLGSSNSRAAAVRRPWGSRPQDRGAATIGQTAGEPEHHVQPGPAFRDPVCRKLVELMLIGSGQHLRRKGPEPEQACDCCGLRRPRSARASAPNRVGRRGFVSQERRATQTSAGGSRVQTPT